MAIFFNDDLSVLLGDIKIILSGMIFMGVPLGRSLWNPRHRSCLRAVAHGGTIAPWGSGRLEGFKSDVGDLAVVVELAG